MTRTRSPRGFTLIELMVVVAIIGVSLALAGGGAWRLRSKANLASATAELQSLFAVARSTALATGHDVGVLVFPDTTVANSTGRVILYEDGNRDFFLGGALNYQNYAPTVLAAAANSSVLTTLDLPSGVTFGPSTFVGPALAAPLSGLPVNSPCTFCSGSPRRGIVRFDPHGRATFYNAAGAAPASSVGGSVTLTSDAGRTLTLAILAGTGAVRFLPTN